MGLRSAKRDEKLGDLGASLDEEELGLEGEAEVEEVLRGEGEVK